MRKINVILLVTNWSLVSALCQAMHEDSSFNIKIICPYEADYLCPNEADYYKQIIKKYENVDFCRNHITIPDLRMFLPDIIFVDIQYDVHFPKAYRLDHLTKIAKVCYIPYSFFLANGNPAFQCKPLHRFWKIFLGAEKAKEDFVTTGKFHSSQIEVSGFTRLDLHSNYSDSTKWKLKKSNKVKRILWVPHWSIKWGYHKSLDEAGFSQFLKYKDYMVTLAERYPNFDIVLRPHPNLFTTLVSSGTYTQDEMNEFKSLINQKPNMSIHEEMECIDVLVSCDFMITDSLTFLAEFLPTMKPLLHLDNPSGPGYNLHGQEIIKAHYQSHNLSDIENFIQTVIIQGNDPKRNLRKKILNTHIYQPIEGVGTYIKNHIKKEFKKSCSSSRQNIRSEHHEIGESDLNAILPLIQLYAKHKSHCRIIDINANCRNILKHDFFNGCYYLGLLNSTTECREYNAKHYNDPSKQFIVSDMLRDIIPKGDIIFAFGIFNKVNDKLGNELITRFRNSQSSHFLITADTEPNYLQYLSKRMTINSSSTINYYSYDMEDTFILPVELSSETYLTVRKFAALLNQYLSEIERNIAPNEYLTFLESILTGSTQCTNFARSIPAIVKRWPIFQDIWRLYFNSDWDNLDTHYKFLNLNSNSHEWANQVTMNVISNQYDWLYFNKK